MTRIFLTKKFDKWAKDEGLTDQQLKASVAEMDEGLHDANLGGSIFKKRIGINGQSKRSSLRTIIAFKVNDRAFFVYGFPKSAMDNISKQEKAALKEQAKVLFSMDEEKIDKASKGKALREIIDMEGTKYE